MSRRRRRTSAEFDTSTTERTVTRIVEFGNAWTIDAAHPFASDAEFISSVTPAVLVDVKARDPFIALLVTEQLDYLDEIRPR